MTKLAIAVATLWVGGCASFVAATNSNATAERKRCAALTPEQREAEAQAKRDAFADQHERTRAAVGAVAGGFAEGSRRAAENPRKREFTCERDIGSPTIPRMTCREN